MVLTNLGKENGPTNIYFFKKPNMMARKQIVHIWVQQTEYELKSHYLIKNTALKKLSPSPYSLLQLFVYTPPQLWNYWGMVFLTGLIFLIRS